MPYRIVCLLALICLPALAWAEEPAAAKPAVAPEGEKQLSGMSVVGNHESPKSLVIVPWKASAPEATLDVARTRDDGRQPVDPEVFLRELAYWELRAAAGAAGGLAAK